MLRKLIFCIIAIKISRISDDHTICVIAVVEARLRSSWRDGAGNQGLGSLQRIKSLIGFYSISKRKSCFPKTIIAVGNNSLRIICNTFYSLFRIITERCGLPIKTLTYEISSIVIAICYRFSSICLTDKISKSIIAKAQRLIF